MSRIGRLFEGFRSARKREARADEPAIRWVVAGLGNPGENFSRSRHNLGFMTVRRLAAVHGAEISRRKFSGVYGEAELAGERAILLMPHTYYNLSGDCVSSLLGYFRLGASDLIVVHDELDLEAGRLRVKRGGGDAGNRGVRSVSEALGTGDFIRVRIGVGRPALEEQSSDYVLKHAGDAELQTLRGYAAHAAEAVESIVAEGLERAMNRFNRRA